MDHINILITGVGAPGIKGTIYSLRNNYDERNIKIIGTDVKEVVVGKYICDHYYNIPKASDKKLYLNTLLDICIKEKVDVILPQNTIELELLARNKESFNRISTKVALSDLEPIQIANNKYQLMQKCLDLQIPVGEFYLVDNLSNLTKLSEKLGWPEKKIIVKPPNSNGLRGIRIIDENIDLKQMFYEEKPTSLFIKMNDLIKILGNNFPELIVTEFLPGDEYTVDIFRKSDKIIVIPRKRDLIRSGITFHGTTKYHNKIINYSKILSENINLEYCFGFQFKLDTKGIPKILECNPRVQGTMVMATMAGANIIYSAVKAALDEKIPEFDIKWGTKLLRYWGGIGSSNSNIIHI